MAVAAHASSKEARISLLVAESCQMNSELMIAAFETHRQPFDVVASPFSPGEILEACERHLPDVCVVSAQLKEGATAGFSALRELTTKYKNVRIVVLLESADRASVVEAFRAGAQGIYSREEPFDNLCKCIHKVFAGQVWISNQQVRYLIDALNVPPPPITDAKGTPLLTKREQTLVRLVTEGRSNRDISRELNLSEHTVRNYLFRIFNKLGTSSRLELALYALNHRQSFTDTPERPM